MFRVINTVTSNIPGTNIVTTEFEHPSILGATKYFAETTGKEWRVAKISKETSSVPAETILEKIDKDTCILAFQRGSNQTGAINDVKTIIKEARKIKPDLYVLVDAVQYAPHGHIDVEKYETDAYTLGLPDAVRLSAAHYNTPEEIDLFLKPTCFLYNTCPINRTKK